MKTPPMLVGAALLFWGWQTDFLVVSVVMAAVLEGSRYVKLRWELSNEDFSRIWVFCTLLFLASAAYAFSASNGPANIRGAFSKAGLAQTAFGTVSTRTAVLLIRWIPLVFFMFVAAQAFSTREGIPLEVISMLLRRRWKRLKKLALPVPSSRPINVAYPYFILCLFASTTHPQPGAIYLFFIGFCVLLMWALWPYRSRRFSLTVWLTAMVVAMSLGFGGQFGLLQLQRAVVQYNPQWLVDLVEGGFDPMETRTEIGQIGRIKVSHRIVIRLDTMNGQSPPTYLRKAGYRTYKAGVWYSDTPHDDFSSINEEPPNSGTWPLFKSKNNPRTLTIACYLPGGKGLLPLPTDSGRVAQLSAYLVQKNRVGAVHTEGPGLVIFDALYGGGGGMETKPDTNEDLHVPEKEQPAISRIISELHLEGMDQEKKLEAISSYFNTQFSYSLVQEAPRTPDTNGTAISRFLLETHQGHCEFFATATVLLLRQLHIPARYVVGYAVHEQSGKSYIVRQNDAHSWCRVWNPERKIWENFDTTPGIWIASQRQQTSRLQFLSDWWSRVVFEFSKFRWGQSPFRQLLPWTLAPILGLLLYQIIFRNTARLAQWGTRKKLAGDAAPGMDSEFYELERALAQRGAPRSPSEPLSDWLRRLANAPDLTALQEKLVEILRLHYRYRFDPHGLSEQHREQLRQEVKSCLTIIGAKN